MGQIITAKEKCSTCNGTGIQPIPEPGNPISCFMCEGTGSRQLSTLFIDEELATMEKVESIIAEQISQRQDLTQALGLIINEQAAQRTDLTAILGAIWDKVKNL